jgi:uncharacterized protein YceK
MQQTGPCNTGVIGCMDMPFSLVLDTVVFPFTLICELGH